MNFNDWFPSTSLLSSPERIIVLISWIFMFMGMLVFDFQNVPGDVAWVKEPWCVHMPPGRAGWVPWTEAGVPLIDFPFHRETTMLLFQLAASDNSSS